MVTGRFLWFLKVTGWFFIVPGRFLWFFRFQVGFMIFNGSRSVFMVFHGFMIFIGSRSAFMVFQGSRCVCYGYSWLWVDFSRFKIGFYGSRLVFHGSRWAFMIAGCFLWFLSKLSGRGVK